ncbi:MAG: hydantoinase/oxoprolinase family protein [Candidatus Rokubacteria bacterium]|nr:hydantoinase/oxoprolinase family protein [Candidatus Rokubacteria bacterium]
MTLTVGIDIGGTFTDLVAFDGETGAIELGKVLTTPADPSVGALEGLRQLLNRLRRPAGDIGNLLHATTLVTNAIIERRGAVTGLITTRGFRDLLEIRRENRYDMYDIGLEMPRPLVRRRLRREVHERVLADGSVAVPLATPEAEEVVTSLVAEGVEAIAVCFLHAYRRGDHESAVRAIVERLAPGVGVSLSSEVVPEIREYERTSTTVANAYVQPLMRRYLGQLRSALADRGHAGGFFVMLSSGGLATVDTAERFPIQLVESGPAAGAMAGSFYTELLGLSGLITFDMGGTTAKTCLIKDRRPFSTTDLEVARLYRFKKGSGLPIRVPSVELIEIGAGGGSLAGVDELGLLRVGPESAGSDPGPACYGRGGTRPTVTDADLLLGYLDADYFLGGEMRLDADAARRALAGGVAGPLGLSLEEAAWGVHAIVNENMTNAARLYLVDRGEDPSCYTMVCFGGAGPVHAYRVAQKLGIKNIVYPLGAGVTSAFGLLVAPFSFEVVRTEIARLDRLDPRRLAVLYAEMEAETRKLLRSAGIAEHDIAFLRSCDMRHVGQSHEIHVEVPEVKERDDLGAVLRQEFDESYARLYHRANPHLGVEVLNWRLVAMGPRPVVRMATSGGGGGGLKGARLVWLPEAGGLRPCPVYDRYRLVPGQTFEGPAIVEERESTAVIGPARIEVDEYLNLRVTVGGR